MKKKTTHLYFNKWVIGLVFFIYLIGLISWFIFLYHPSSLPEGVNKMNDEIYDKALGEELIEEVEAKRKEDGTIGFGGLFKPVE